MRLWIIAGVVYLAGGLGVTGPSLLAQDTKSPPAPARKPAEKTQQQVPKDAPPDAPAPAPQPSPAGTQPPDASKPRHSTAQDNPFPEDISKKAAGQPTPDAPAANPPLAGDSSSRTGMDSLDLDGAKEKNDRTRLKLTDPDTGQPYDPKLAKDDDRIGEFYLKSGNYPGAYARFKEASAANPGDAGAIFGLAESARKMNKIQEAADSYQVYLDAFPDGPKAKAARKALSELKLPDNKP